MGKKFWITINKYSKHKVKKMRMKENWQKEFITAVLLENVQLVKVAVPLLYIAPPCIYHAISGAAVAFHERVWKKSASLIIVSQVGG